MQSNWLEVQEDTPANLVDRLVGLDQTVLVTSDVSGISYAVFNVDSANPTSAFTSGTFGTTCVYTRLITDNYWKTMDGEFVDTQGYNVRYELPAAFFPADSRHIRLELTYTPTTGNAFINKYDFMVSKIYGS